MLAQETAVRAVNSARPVKDSFVRKLGVTVLGGSSHPALASQIAEHIGAKHDVVDVQRFPNSELRVRVPEISDGVHGRDIYVVQPTTRSAREGGGSVNDAVMELALTLDALRRGDPARVTAVVPCFGYQRQERQPDTREPISASLVADMIERAGADRIMVVDIHAPAIQGFFRIPVELLSSMETLATAVRERHDTRNLVVVSPDAGGVARAGKFAELMGAPIALVHKERDIHTGQTRVVDVVGDVAGKSCVIVDDIISTGGTLIHAAEALQERGAGDVIVAATHGEFIGDSLDRLQASILKQIYVTDTIPQPGAGRGGTAPPKLVVVSVAPLLGQAIQRAHVSGGVTL